MRRVKDVIMPVDGIPFISTEFISRYILGANDNTEKDRKIRTFVSRAGNSVYNDDIYMDIEKLKDGSELEKAMYIRVTNKDDYYSSNKDINAVIMRRWFIQPTYKDRLCICKNIPMNGYLLSRAAIKVFKDKKSLLSIQDKDKMVQIIDKAFADYNDGNIDNIVPCILDDISTEENVSIFDKIKNIITEEEARCDVEEGIDSDSTIEDDINNDSNIKEDINSDSNIEDSIEGNSTVYKKIIPDMFMADKSAISKEILTFIDKNIDRFYSHEVSTAYDDGDDVLSNYFGVKEEWGSHYVFFINTKIVMHILGGRAKIYNDVMKALRKDRLLWDRMQHNYKKTYHMKRLNCGYLYNFPVMIHKSVIDGGHVNNSTEDSLKKEVADLKAKLVQVEERTAKTIENIRNEFENAVNYRVKNELNSIWTAIAALKEKEDLTKNGLRRLVESL